MLCHACILGGAQHQARGTKSEVAASPLPSRGPKKRAEMLRHPYILGGSPNKRGQNQKRLPHPCLLRGPKEGGNAMSPLHSRGFPNKGTKSKGATPPLPSRGPKKRAEMLCHPCILGGPQTKGGKIKRGCLTPAFSGAQKRAEMLCHPYILRGPQTRGQNQKGLPHPCLLGGPKRGRKCYVTPAFSGVPKQRGTKSKVAALGTRTKLWVCSPKECHQKNFAQMVCLHRKTPLKNPHGPFLKRGRIFRNPSWYRISENPPPPPGPC